MSQFIEVFLSNAKPIPLSEIAEFIIDGVYFEEDPTFSPTDATSSSETNWKTLEVHYASGRAPVIFHNTGDEKDIRELVEECIEEQLASAKPSTGKDEAIRLVRLAKRAVGIEIKPDCFPEEGWEMLSSLEAFLARSRDGVVYVPDDGVYDKELKPLLPLRPEGT